MNKELTVEELHKMLDELVENGYGDIKICVDDIVVNRDYIGINYANRKLIIRQGTAIRCEKLKAISELEVDMKKAIDKYMKAVAE